mmetsp:Transcript_22303/g.75406  ORF Transcript_22303/g.75406 Transcript_22303/m.75406 type:complete len:243 (+) Transcript_22303:494-1222(+)
MFCNAPLDHLAASAVTAFATATGSSASSLVTKTTSSLSSDSLCAVAVSGKASGGDDSAPEKRSAKRPPPKPSEKSLPVAEGACRSGSAARSRSSTSTTPTGTSSAPKTGRLEYLPSCILWSASRIFLLAEIESGRGVMTSLTRSDRSSSTSPSPCVTLEAARRARLATSDFDRMPTSLPSSPRTSTDRRVATRPSNATPSRSSGRAVAGGGRPSRADVSIGIAALPKPKSDAVEPARWSSKR